MNMTKIAKLAGCSLSTVSKAFRNSPEISEETRNKIFEIAKQNNCFDKYYSPVYEKRVFAVICKELITSSYGTIVDALNEKISANGDTLLISTCNFVNTALDELLDYYINFHKVDGLIIISSKVSDIEFAQKIPTVMIQERGQLFSPNCDRVETTDNYGINSVISYLKANGHTKIGYIGEYLTQAKKAIFKETMEKLGLEVVDNWIVTSSKRKGEAGYDGMDRILSQPSRPTAIFAAYDAIAFGAINKLHMDGLRVPDDFSFVSCDNIPLSKFSCPPLTTISTPVEELSEAAISLLYRRLQNINAPYQTVTIQSKMVIRDSVKKI